MTDSDGALLLPASAVIFDNDGVLVDSGASVDRAWSGWAAAHGLDAAEVLAAAHSRPSRETVARFVPEADRRAALLDIDRLELEDAGSVTALPGAAELLAQLPSGRWAVVTSANRALARARLTAAGLPIPVTLVTADDVRHGKPDPEGYALAVARLGVDPSAAIVLEDSAGGIAAAQAAGVGTIVGIGAKVLQSAAAVVVRDLRDTAWHDCLRIGTDGRLR